MENMAIDEVIASTIQSGGFAGIVWYLLHIGRKSIESLEKRLGDLCEQQKQIAEHYRMAELIQNELHQGRAILLDIQQSAQRVERMQRRHMQENGGDEA